MNPIPSADAALARFLETSGFRLQRSGDGVPRLAIPKRSMRTGQPAGEALLTMTEIRRMFETASTKDELVRALQHAGAVRERI